MRRFAGGLNFGAFNLATYFSKGEVKKKKQRTVPEFISLLKLVVDAEKQQQLDEIFAKYQKREVSRSEFVNGIVRIAGKRTISRVLSLLGREVTTSNQALGVDQKLALYKLFKRGREHSLEGFLRECLAIIGEVPLNDELLKTCKQLNIPSEANAREWIQALRDLKVHETTVNLQALALNEPMTQ